MTKERKGAGCLLAGFGLAALGLACLLSPFNSLLGIPLGTFQISQREKKLQKPAFYQTASTNLALYCQSVSTLNLTSYVRIASLPQPLPSFKHGRGMFESNRARIEFGGAFLHYGYSLVLDELASTPQSNVWNLLFYREGSPDKSLMRFVLPKSARISSIP